MDNRSFSSTALFGPFPVHQPIPVAHHCVPRLSSASTVAVSMDIYSHRPSMPARRPPRRSQHPLPTSPKMDTRSFCSTVLFGPFLVHQHIPRGPSFCPTAVIGINRCRLHGHLYSHRPSMPARRPPPHAQHPSRLALNWMTAPSLQRRYIFRHIPCSGLPPIIDLFPQLSSASTCCRCRSPTLIPTPAHQSSKHAHCPPRCAQRPP
jgi:hypothetical protein